MKLKKSPAPKPLLQTALDIIEQSSFRLTLPRRHILDAIFAQKGPFAATDLQLKHLGADPVTIYRTLPVFEELGIIEKCDFSEGVAYYEVALNKTHHHHVVCKNCKNVEPLDFCVVQGQEQILEKMGYTHLTHRLEFAGLCPRCSK